MIRKTGFVSGLFCCLKHEIKIYKNNKSADELIADALVIENGTLGLWGMLLIYR